MTTTSSFELFLKRKNCSFEHFRPNSDRFYFAIAMIGKQILKDALLYLMCEVMSVCSAGNLSLKSQ